MQQAEALVAELRARGVELVPEPPDKLRLRPASDVSAELKAQIVQHKAEVLALLAGRAEGQAASRVPAVPDPDLVARLLNMPLDRFEREGRSLELRVGWWPEALFFVPDARHAELLVREGIARHRLWTAGELDNLLAGPGPWAPKGLTVVMQARRVFNGEVVAVLPRADRPAR